MATTTVVNLLIFIYPLVNLYPVRVNKISGLPYLRMKNYLRSINVLRILYTSYENSPLLYYRPTIIKYPNTYTCFFFLT